MKKILLGISTYDIFVNLKLDTVNFIPTDKGFLFEIYGEKRYRLEKFLNANLKENNKLVSNKNKSVIVEFNGKYSELISENNGQGDLWSISIYQKNSRSCKFYSIFRSTQMGLYYPIFQGFELKYQMELEKKIFHKSLKKQKKDILKQILNLSEKDLHIFLDRSLLTSFEIKQFLYSYKKDILDYYDFNVERIDDKKTYDFAVESNNDIEEHKALYEKVARKHKIELKKGEVWEYLEADQDYSWFVLFFEKNFWLKIIKV